MTVGRVSGANGEIDVVYLTVPDMAESVRMTGGLGKYRNKLSRIMTKSKKMAQKRLMDLIPRVLAELRGQYLVLTGWAMMLNKLSRMVR